MRSFIIQELLRIHTLLLRLERIVQAPGQDASRHHPGALGEGARSGKILFPLQCLGIPQSELARMHGWMDAWTL